MASPGNLHSMWIFKYCIHLLKTQVNPKNKLQTTHERFHLLSFNGDGSRFWQIYEDFSLVCTCNIIIYKTLFIEIYTFDGWPVQKGYKSI